MHVGSLVERYLPLTNIHLSKLERVRLVLSAYSRQDRVQSISHDLANYWLATLR